MLIIRDAQMNVFRKQAVDQYALELAAHCRAFSPRLCETLRDEELHAAVVQGMERARSHGFTQRGPVRLYMDMTILLGSGFDSDPQYPWAAPILARNEESGQMERADALHTKIRAYLREVDGDQNIHTQNALAALAASVRHGLSFVHDSLEPDLLRLMAELHPRKVAASGEAALQQLIAAGMAKASKRHGFESARSIALTVVLMFAFGHDFDADPLLPWISRSLSPRQEPARPEAIAQRLERRALVWLDAVLRHAHADG